MTARKVRRVKRIKVRKVPKILPSQEELKLQETDVICGRGSGVTCWKGNIEFRYLCYKVKPLYVMADRTAKTAIALDLINEMATLNPPGRFVELIEGTEIDDKRCLLVPQEQAIEKTCQALREKKNGCPRLFRPFESAKKSRDGDINFEAPKFSKAHITNLRKSLEQKFITTSRGKRTKNLDEDSVDASEDEQEVAKPEIIASSTRKIEETANRSRRLTARQAVIESILESKQAPTKRKEPEAELFSKMTPQTTKKPKFQLRGPPTEELLTAPLSSVYMPKLGSAAPINLFESFKPIERRSDPTPMATPQPQQPSTKSIVTNALDFQTKPIAASQIDKEMALFPPTMTAFCSGIFNEMMSSNVALDVPPPPRRRYPSKTPRKTHSMLPLSPPQSLLDDDDDAAPTLDQTTLKTYITQGSNSSSDEPPKTFLASYLSDFFDKKYFPVNSTSKYFSGNDCKVAPLQTDLQAQTSQSPTTVFCDLFRQDSIVCYNQALFDDDLEDDIVAPIEAFPDL
ncbi:hypothetical protein MPSEU_000649700 [Mayamaea pseudoterrestris]|nr:hypothetical protein MPSEU_000649700 [Mayamaea pseudoterrestris]